LCAPDVLGLLFDNDESKKGRPEVVKTAFEPGLLQSQLRDIQE
jgi:hypothetical protein